MTLSVDPRRPQRQDTFDLRNEIHVEESNHRGQGDTTSHTSDEDHSVMEDDSSNEDRDNDYMEDDDGSSSLSIPNESIDFDLVYSLHNFAATVEGQASVVKGDSLYLMDDSNSYWWLVRVLTTQEVGYIPAENIETPFERLARLNKHRNVDLAAPTQEESSEANRIAHEREAMRAMVRNGASPNGHPGDRRTVIFGESSRVFTYPPAVWHTEDEDDGEWEDDDMEYDEPYEQEINGDDDMEAEGLDGMEPDDGMSWESSAVEEERARAAAVAAANGATSPLTPTIAGNAPAPVPTPGPTQPQLSPVITSPVNQQNGGVRQQSSREKIYEPSSQNDSVSPVSANSNSPTSTIRAQLDPAIAGETRQISVTPLIAKEAARQSILAQQNALAEENAKRAREEAEAAAAEENARKKGKVKDMQPVSSATMNRVASNDSVKSGSSGSKLRKGRESPAPSQESFEEGGKKKKGGVFSGLFGRKKDKDKKSENGEIVRNSEDSSRSSQYAGSAETAVSPTSRTRNTVDPRRANAGSTPTPGQQPTVVQPIISQHTLKMQQIDQQQQALYQQYLKSSPATAPEASYGLQSASSVMPTNGNNLSANFRTQGGRPGSLILSPTLDGQGVPELSVIRVFAGPNVHTEATFKTVLLNTSTTSADLIRQAMQRFRLAAGEDEGDYYLEIKQIEGQSAVLLPHEKPLGVFESLVEASMSLPTVRRGSFGSINSVSSNLSAHPAIKKLSMNDFTDDSAVKFYLNRKSSQEDLNDSDSEDDTLTPRISVDEYGDEVTASPTKPSLNLSNLNAAAVTPERFTSPSTRFPLQVFILPEDLPDGMVFDPQTEAIVPKSSLRDRSLTSAGASSGVSQTERRKVLNFPKNTTVAEVIELALERFGIAEGVVDGGDEVEDKLSKRVSLARVRYGLAVQVNGQQQERNLQPSSKILDAFSRPPIFRPVDRRSGEKRRSVDSAMLLNSAEDIRPDDPIFILRRAVGLRNTGKSKMNTPLDEIALEKKRYHRESVLDTPNVSITDESKSGVAAPQQGMSRQELIAAQRLASREKQRAILSAQTNSERGVDILLSGNRMLQSSQHPAGDKMRYSYVQDGETFDITDIVEEEQRGGKHGEGKQDWLETVARNSDGLGDNLDRLLNKIKGTKTTPAGGKTSALSTATLTAEELRRVSDMSSYSVSDHEEQQPAGRQIASSTQVPAAPRAVSATSTDHTGSKNVLQREKQSSMGSLRSDSSSNEATTPSTPATTAHARSNTPRRGPLIMKDDFGVANMMAIIEYNAATKRPPPRPPVDAVEQMLFGTYITLDELHPRVREMYAGTLKELEDMDKQLDRALAAVSRAF